MPLVPVDFKYKFYPWPKPTGGISGAPKNDTENQTLVNCDLQRDGYYRTRKGLVQLHTDGQFGGGQIVALAEGPCGTSSDALLVAAVGDTPGQTSVPQKIYYADLNNQSTFPLSFQYFTLPSPWVINSSTDQLVYFEFVTTVLNGTTQNVVLIASNQWTDILQFAPGSSTATVISGFPNIYVQDMVWHQGYLWVIEAGTSNIHISQASDFTTWPTTGVLPLDQICGLPTVLKSLQDRLMIFCQTGIRYLVGDPYSSPFVGLLAPDTPGPSNPAQVTAYGGTVSFPSRENILTISSGMQSISDATLGLYMQQSFPVYPCGLASNGEMIGFRSYEASGSTVGQTSFWWYERVRWGSWNKWVFSANSALGTVPPNNIIVKALSIPFTASPHFVQGFIFPSANGNVYFQEVTYFSDLSTYYPFAPTYTDYPSGTFTNKWVTNWSSLGTNNTVQKQIRQIQIMGSGNITSLVVVFMLNGQQHSSTLVSTSTSLPLILNVPFLALPCQAFQEIQLQIQGNGLTIHDIQVMFRQLRYGGMYS